MPTVRYSISMDAIDDADVIRWLDKQGTTSEAIRRAVRAYINSPTQLETKMDRLIEMVQKMKVVEVPEVEEAQTEEGEPAKARAGLDAMKKKFRDG